MTYSRLNILQCWKAIKTFLRLNECSCIHDFLIKWSLSIELTFFLTEIEIVLYIHTYIYTHTHTHTHSYGSIINTNCSFMYCLNVWFQFIATQWAEKWELLYIKYEGKRERRIKKWEIPLIVFCILIKSLIIWRSNW